MNKTIKLLIAASLLIAAAEVAAQDEKCNFVCHNNTVIKVLNDNALQGHLQHGDLFLGSCEDFTGNIGGACGVLSAPDFDFKAILPIGKKYFVINSIGQIVKEGKIDKNFINDMPSGQVYFLKIKGYKLKKFYKND